MFALTRQYWYTYIHVHTNIHTYIHTLVPGTRSTVYVGDVEAEVGGGGVPQCLLSVNVHVIVHSCWTFGVRLCCSTSHTYIHDLHTYIHPYIHTYSKLRPCRKSHLRSCTRASLVVTTQTCNSDAKSTPRERQATTKGVNTFVQKSRSRRPIFV